MKSMPDLTNLQSYLSQWKDKSAYIIPMTDGTGRILGNNGDELMGRVFHKILERAKIRATIASDTADVVIVPPSGSLLEIYSFPMLLEKRLKGYENVPLIIMPSSAYFPAIDPSFIFNGRTASTLWILREKKSYDHLQSMWGHNLDALGVELALDHDVVASGHEFVPAIIGQASNCVPLIAGRLDREATSLDGQSLEKTSVSLTIRVAKLLALMLPYGRLYTRVARFSLRKRNRFAGRSLCNLVETMTEEPIETFGAVYVDASDLKYATFQEYCAYVANASVVITDRLHVGLPAAILGKRVYFVEAGYHKISGLYSRSLTEMENVTFLRRNSNTREG